LNWLLWQLADSAFPTGGFAHSGGLEAAWQLGKVADFDAYLDQSLWQVGHQAVPFARAAARDGRRLVELDALADATLTNHVANRASRALGRNFWATASRVFDLSALAAEARQTSMHHAPIFGAGTAALGLSADETVALFLHLALRGTLSAAVRLGIVGPLEAQGMMAARGALLNDVTERCSAIEPEEASETSPLLGACAALHDGLYARLFQS